jgi:hypothetical protein
MNRNGNRSERTGVPDASSSMKAQFPRPAEVPMRRALCFPLLLATLITIPAAAQQPPAKKGAFATVIKQATGKNGYEELVMAGDLLESCRRWKQVEAEPNASLTTKRAVLAEPQVVQALRLLRAGLLKPVGSPREAATFDTLLPELAPFRSLGRLLALQQYVFCADGRISDALGNARLSLRLGQVIQTDTLISGLVGVAVSAICIQQLGAHLDQLSARDTEVLHAICLEWLRQPNPEARLMESERRTVAASLDDLRGQGADRLISALNLDPKPRPDDDDAIRRSRQLAAELRTLGDAAALPGLRRPPDAPGRPLRAHSGAVSPPPLEAAATRLPR